MLFAWHSGRSALVVSDERGPLLLLPLGELRAAGWRVEADEMRAGLPRFHLDLQRMIAGVH